MMAAQRVARAAAPSARVAVTVLKLSISLSHGLQTCDFRAITGDWPPTRLGLRFADPRVHAWWARHHLVPAARRRLRAATCAIILRLCRAAIRRDLAEPHHYQLRRLRRCTA